MLLKAILIDKNESIYYKDEQDRTISLIDAVKKIYPDKHTRIRLNLEKIIELRNISTHFITEEYEVKYAPLFQACVLNYTNELEKYQNRDITKYISRLSNFINSLWAIKRWTDKNDVSCWNCSKIYTTI